MGDGNFSHPAESSFCGQWQPMSPRGTLEDLRHLYLHLEAGALSSAWWTPKQISFHSQGHYRKLTFFNSAGIFSFNHITILMGHPGQAISLYSRATLLGMVWKRNWSLQEVSQEVVVIILVRGEGDLSHCCSRRDGKRRQT